MTSAPVLFYGEEHIMSYYDIEHQNKIRQLDSLWNNLVPVEDLAEEYDISDIAQDNNLKLLQTLVLFDFENQPGREGSDAIDRYGHEWELKTVNIDLTTSFSTNHHTTFDIINAFRRERWLFSAYEGIQLVEVYAVSPRALEPYFTRWENELRQAVANGEPNPHKNNPKIPLKFVRSVGVSVYPIRRELDPAELLRNI